MEVTFLEKAAGVKIYFSLLIIESREELLSFGRNDFRREFAAVRSAAGTTALLPRYGFGRDVRNDRLEAWAVPAK
jgi:hypothetical protein